MNLHREFATRKLCRVPPHPFTRHSSSTNLSGQGHPWTPPWHPPSPLPQPWDSGRHCRAQAQPGSCKPRLLPFSSSPPLLTVTTRAKPGWKYMNLQEISYTFPTGAKQSVIHRNTGLIKHVASYPVWYRGSGWLCAKFWNQFRQTAGAFERSIPNTHRELNRTKKLKKHWRKSKSF